jgi:hypothetical protein
MRGHGLSQKQKDSRRILIRGRPEGPSSNSHVRKGVVRAVLNVSEARRADTSQKPVKLSSRTFGAQFLFLHLDPRPHGRGYFLTALWALIHAGHQEMLSEAGADKSAV